MAEMAEMSNNNNTSNDNASPWPEIENGSVAFLLDARDDFEARLLRDWVEAQKPETGTHPQHWFISLADGRADDLLGSLPERGNSVWMQPLRIAWLPSEGAASRRSLQDFFYGRIAEPGKVRRRWLAKHQPERVAYVVGDGAFFDEVRERLAGPTGSDDELSEFVANQAL
ncbi:MAG: hypothetical protein ACR2QR_07995, partial [Woeseiaceae bacterium]